MKLKNKKGLTIVETIVAIAIFTIGIEGFTLLFAKSWKSNSYIFEMGQTAFAVSQGVNKLSGYIRKARQADDGAYPIKSADDNDFVVFSDFDKDGVTERLHFYYSGGKIFMGVTDPTGGFPKTYPAGDQQTQTIAENIVNDAGTSVFYYYNKDYPGDQANNPLSTPADVSIIRLVKVYLEININPNHSPDNIHQQTFIELRNLNDYDRIQ